MLVKRQKKFGVLGAIGKTWKSGAWGKTKVLGGAALATGAVGAGVAGAKFAGASKDALKGEMGEDY